ncbi:MAG: hypothetical protein ACK4QL_10390 [Pseudanabaenaceae cyanobacterium]
MPLVPEHIAEVVSTSTTEYVAECLPPKDLCFPQVPALGSWVKTISFSDDQTTVYGVVAFSTTTAIDNVHRAMALGLSLEELRAQQPQIFGMFRSELRVALLGYQVGSQIYQHLPPHPPQIHQAVYLCSRDEVIQFTEELHFWRSLLSLTGVPVDELLSAILRQVYQLRACDRHWLVQSAKQLGMLFKEDYDRLRAVLAQVHP